MPARRAPSDYHTKKHNDRIKTPGPVLNDRLLKAVRLKQQELEALRQSYQQLVLRTHLRA